MKPLDGGMCERNPVIMFPKPLSYRASAFVGDDRADTHILPVRVGRYALSSIIWEGSPLSYIDAWQEELS